MLTVTAHVLDRHLGGTVKRRLFALLAIPALAMGLTFALSGADEADALAADPYLHCSVARFLIAYHESYGNHVAAGEIYTTAVASGCDPWNLL
jgi:hypothetical protein